MRTYRGKVVRGGKRATQLGFPTTNIPCKDASILSGIFVARATLDGVAYDAVAYADPARGLLEAHLLDFEGDLYGRELSITLLEKLRESVPFASDEEACKAIAADVEAARRYFNS